MMWLMPAKNPRLTITLRPSVKAQLERLSSLTGNSQGALVAEIIDASEPVFERLITVLEAAVIARESLSAKVPGDLDAAQKKLEQTLGITLELFDSTAKPILDEAEKVKRRARRNEGSGASAQVRSAHGLTPPSNRGVRSQTKRANSSTKTKV